jgi:tetratricopeptide (TPR) repeat protein
MSNKLFWLSFLGILLAFAVGFLIANALNRSQISNLLAENARLTNGQKDLKENSNKQDISEKEIADSILKAEKNPKDFSLQKGLGLALSKLAMYKQDPALFEKAEALLDRAHELNANDYEVMVSLGNVNFDLGQINKDSVRNTKARRIYKKALGKNPNDVNVITDYGLTFLLTMPPDLDRAKTELAKTLALDPKQERALQYMTRTQIEIGNFEEADGYLKRLKEVNPANPGLKDLDTKISRRISNK